MKDLIALIGVALGVPPGDTARQKAIDKRLVKVEEDLAESDADAEDVGALRELLEKARRAMPDDQDVSDETPAGITGEDAPTPASDAQNSASASAESEEGEEVTPRRKRRGAAVEE